MVSSVSASGSGNAVTALSVSSGKLTYTKGYVINSVAYDTSVASTGNVIEAYTVSNNKLSFVKTNTYIYTGSSSNNKVQIITYDSDNNAIGFYIPSLKKYALISISSWYTPS